MALPRLLRSPFPRHPPDIDQAFARWLESPLGQALVAEERELLAQVLPSLAGTRAVQLGVGRPVPLLEASRMPLRWTLGLREGELRASPEALPLAKRSMDLVLLHHSLDFADRPHQVLREAVHSLDHGGHLVVVGFHPVSLWGLARLFRLGRGQVPWAGRFLRPHRVSDWLHVLACRAEGLESGFHNLPLQGERARRRLGWLERAGQRAWSQHGAFYVLVARRQAVNMRPLREHAEAAQEPIPNVVPVSMARWRRQTREEQS